MPISTSTDDSSSTRLVGTSSGSFAAYRCAPPASRHARPRSTHDDVDAGEVAEEHREDAARWRPRPSRRRRRRSASTRSGPNRFQRSRWCTSGSSSSDSATSNTRSTSPGAGVSSGRPSTMPDERRHRERARRRSAGGRARRRSRPARARARSPRAPRAARPPAASASTRGVDLAAGERDVALVGREVVGSAGEHEPRLAVLVEHGEEHRGVAQLADARAPRTRRRVAWNGCAVDRPRRREVGERGADVGDGEAALLGRRGAPTATDRRRRSRRAAGCAVAHPRGPGSSVRSCLRHGDSLAARDVPARGRCYFFLPRDLGEHVAARQHEEVLAVDRDLGAAVLRVQDDVARGDVHRDQLAACARSDGPGPPRGPRPAGASPWRCRG